MHVTEMCRFPLEENYPFCPASIFFRNFRYEPKCLKHLCLKYSYFFWKTRDVCPLIDITKQATAENETQMCELRLSNIIKLFLEI